VVPIVRASARSVSIFKCRASKEDGAAGQD